MIRTFEDACDFVLRHKVVTVFGSKGSPHPSLWDNTDLSEDKPAEGGWSPKVTAVWDWKTRIPQTFPDENDLWLPFSEVHLDIFERYSAS